MGGYKENSLVGTAPTSYYLFVTEDDNLKSCERILWVEQLKRAIALAWI
jgi:hypothetical protein